MRICIPIIAETEDVALRKMTLPVSADRSLEILFELRLDRMREIKLERILKEREKKIVVTNRRREEGGGFSGTEQERISYLLKAVDLGADYVDLEASTDAALLAAVKTAISDQGGKTLLILSSHDFGNTPSEQSLRQKLEEIVSIKPGIVKIVSRADSQEDNLRSLSLIPYARKNGQEIISFCMGEMGRMSRVMSLFLGAYMSFASLSAGEESAPGQFSFAEMVTVLSVLSGSNVDIQGRLTLQSPEEGDFVRAKRFQGPGTTTGAVTRFFKNRK